MWNPRQTPCMQYIIIIITHVLIYYNNIIFDSYRKFFTFNPKRAACNDLLRLYYLNWYKYCIFRVKSTKYTTKKNVYSRNKGCTRCTLTRCSQIKCDYICDKFYFKLIFILILFTIYLNKLSTSEFLFKVLISNNINNIIKNIKNDKQKH